MMFLLCTSMWRSPSSDRAQALKGSVAEVVRNRMTFSYHASSLQRQILVRCGKMCKCRVLVLATAWEYGWSIYGTIHSNHAESRDYVI